MDEIYKDKIALFRYGIIAPKTYFINRFYFHFTKRVLNFFINIC